MRLSKTALGGAVLMAIALSACTTPGQVSRSEENRRMIDREYGAVGPRSNPEAFRLNGHDGQGFTMFRLYSEKPIPNSFGKTVPETFDNTLVVDFGVDMKIEDRFPLYRIGVDPTKLSERRIDLWPSHVVLESQAPDGTPRKLAARLPESRAPGADGMIWSDWTYCADCFGLEDIRDAGLDDAARAFSSLGQAYEVAGQKNSAGSAYEGRASFTLTPGVGILIGEAAVDMAGKASDVVAASQVRLDAMRPARDAYAAMSRDFAQTRSPSREIERLCGTYEPNRDVVNVAGEKDRVEAFLACGASTIEGYDGSRRAAEVESFRAYERELARKAGLEGDQRMSFPSFAVEVDAANAVLKQSEERYRGFARAMGVAVPAAVKKADPKPAAALVDPIVERAQAAIDRSAKQPKAPVTEPTVETPVEKPAEKTTAEKPSKDVYYVARLLPDGANMDIGQQKTGCIGDVSCETGSIVALIAATGYCQAEGEITKTAPGWGMLVQRYLPSSRAEEKMILAGDGTSKVHVVTSDDKSAMSEGLDAVRALTMNDSQIFFTSYQSFYEVNTEEKGCKDMWRDAAKQRVIQNPAEASKD